MGECLIGLLDIFNWGMFGMACLMVLAPNYVVLLPGSDFLFIYSYTSPVNGYFSFFVTGF